MEYFGLKLGQDLGNRAAHPYQEFRGVPPPGPHHKTFINCLEIETVSTEARQVTNYQNHGLFATT